MDYGQRGERLIRLRQGYGGQEAKMGSRQIGTGSGQFELI
jgi:hypothetical protein